MTGNRIVKRLHQCHRRSFPGLKQGRIPLLGHGEESWVLLSRDTHQRSQRSKVFTLSLSHLRSERLEVQRCEHGCLLLTHNLAVVSAAGSPKADPERLATKSTVRGRLQHLWSDFLL